MTCLSRRSAQFAIRAMTASVAVRSLKFLTSDRRLRAGFEVIAQFTRIGEIGYAPAVEIVFGETGFGEPLEPVGVAGCHRAEERVAADFLSRSAVVDLVELVPSAEFAGHGVPQQLHQFYAIDRLVPI